MIYNHIASHKFLFRYCGGRFVLYQELVIHIRFNHLLETIDISSTELEEVCTISLLVKIFYNVCVSNRQTAERKYVARSALKCAKKTYFMRFFFNEAFLVHHWILDIPD